MIEDHWIAACARGANSGDYGWLCTAGYPIRKRPSGELRESLPVDAEINGVVQAAVDRFMEDAEQFDNLTMPGLEYFGPAAAMEE